MDCRRIWQLVSPQLVQNKRLALVKEAYGTGDNHRRRPPVLCFTCAEKTDYDINVAFKTQNAEFVQDTPISDTGLSPSPLDCWFHSGCIDFYNNCLQPLSSVCDTRAEEGQEGNEERLLLSNYLTTNKAKNLLPVYRFEHIRMFVKIVVLDVRIEVEMKGFFTDGGSQSFSYKTRFLVSKYRMDAQLEAD